MQPMVLVSIQHLLRVILFALCENKLYDYLVVNSSIEVVVKGYLS